MSHRPTNGASPDAPLERVLDQLPEVYYRCRLGPQPRCELLSTRFSDLTGHDREAFVGEDARELTELIHPEDVERVLAEYSRATAARRPFVLHYRLVRNGGDVRHVCERGGVLEEEDGSLLRHGAILDETERLWAEREMEEHAVELQRRTRSQDLLLSLLREISEVSQTLLLAQSEDQVYPVITDAIARGTGAPFVAFYMIGGGGVAGRDGGASSSDLLGYQEMSASGPAAGQSGQPPKWQSIAQGLVGDAVRKIRVEIVSGDEVPGAPEWKSRHGVRTAMVFPLIFQHGAAGALLVLDAQQYSSELIQGVDLLAREAVAALLSTHRAQQLTREVSLRHELIEQLKQTNQHLDRARTRAEQANEMKSRFLANVSHEIRTPLNGILGMSELMAATELDAEQADSLHALRSCADALLLLLNDILDLSKIEAGRLELEEIDYSLLEVVDGALEAVDVRARERGIELGAVVAPDVPCRLNGDPSRLRQVLTNLLGNSVKFTEGGRVALRARLAREPSGATVVEIAIEDTGIGISPERIEAIFDPFVQAESSTNRRFGGTGLGLAICRQLVEMMGGRITCESEPGRGSRFAVRVPLRPAAERRAPRERTGESIDAVVRGPESLARLGAEAYLVRAGARLADEADDGSRSTRLLARLLLAGDDASVQAVSEEFVAWERGGGSVLLIADRDRGEDVDAIRERRPVDVLWTPLRAGALDRALDRAAGYSGPLSGPIGADVGDAIRGLRVLLAEDHPVNQKLATKMLERAGCRVSIAANGREAVEAFTRENFDVVLMDMQMPELDGLGATREIRALGGTATIVPIVALTANAMKGDREACLAAGMTGYLTKPFRQEQLVDAIAAATGARLADPQPV